MSNENTSIHDFDFQLICNYFKEVERQGPGSPEVTRLAASFLNPLSPEARIADIGCGTGGQTRVLAGTIPGHITGIDLFPDFIEIFNRKAKEYGLEDRLTGMTRSMDDLPFQHEELDVIWSEGAIYNIGFERGLKEWNCFLKPGGFIAVTEVSWFTEERPAEIEDFWMDAYPEINTISAKVDQLQKAGYKPVAHFILPDICWTDHFYIPQVSVQQRFLKEYANHPAMTDFIANQQQEMKLYYRYKDYYGYVFYIGQKI